MTNPFIIFKKFIKIKLAKFIVKEIYLLLRKERFDYVITSIIQTLDPEIRG